MDIKDQAADELYCIQLAANEVERNYLFPGWEQRCAANTARALATAKRQHARLNGRTATDIFDAFGK